MDDREWLAPEALAVLNLDSYWKDTGEEYRKRCLWRAAGRPLLTAQARAVLEAVEAQMKHCATYCDMHGRGCEVNDFCPPLPKAIRRAYLGTETKPAGLSPARKARIDALVQKQVAGEIERGELKPPCSTCNGSKRVKCEYQSALSPACTRPPAEDCPHEISWTDDDGMCQLPCPTCGAK